MENNKSTTVKEKRKEISVSLIANRNIVNKKGLSADQIADSLLRLSHIRLDRENIKCIENLDCLGPVTNLYLQWNDIKEIENLEALTKLKFLMLAENKITKIQNLKHLDSLMFLDLSDNQIEDFNSDELPNSLIILNLSGNPCVSVNDYRSKVLRSLHKLEQLDGKNITKQQRKECGCVVVESESDSEEEEHELMGEEEQGDDYPGTGTGALNQHGNDILVRAKIRTMK
ncbi:hypothetical protein QZH41_016985, partial [Actinostola sp. cb2023]